jgi:hypothetical protein
MYASAGPKFAHRHLASGTVDSICLKCYRTIAITTDEADREAQEAAHECKGLDLAELLTPPTPKRP